MILINSALFKETVRWFYNTIFWTNTFANYFLILTSFYLTILNNVLSVAIIHEYVNPCQPSPCGPNSQCREVNEQAVCSCLPTFIGSPPGCRPECVVSSECSLDKACSNQKCTDPCQGTCGINTICRVNNHSPICSCKNGYTGDPFIRCSPIPRKILSCFVTKICDQWKHYHFLAPPEVVHEEVRDPCYPSPCGPNSQCRNVNGIPSCSCLPTYIGAPPNCRPECTINSECTSNKACIREKCNDPCPGSCGLYATCSVINHTPICTCTQGYVGDPFVSCHPAPPPRKKLLLSKTLEPFNK